MATYSAVASGEKDADSPITVSLIDKLDQNPHAIAEGASGAPKIQNAAFDDNTINGGRIVHDTVGIDEIKTGQAVASDSITGGSTAQVALVGGEYGFYPEINYDYTALGNGSYQVEVIFLYQNENLDFAYDQVISAKFNNSSNVSATLNVRSRYFTASPPYRINKTDYRDFLFLRLSKDGTIKSVSMATDPIWFHNGPTKICYSHKCSKTGKQFARLKKKRPRKSIKCEADAIEIISYATSHSAIVEMTQELKHMDMDVISHPFPRLDDGDRVVLVEPSQYGCYAQLCDLFQEGEDVLSIINGGYILVNTDEIKTNDKPKSVKMHSVKWKRT